MTETSKSKAVPSWEEIEAKTLEPLDLSDVGVHWAVSRWRAHVERGRAPQDAGEATDSLRSPEVIEALVRFFREDIAENEATYRARAARNRRRLALMNIDVVLGESQGVFVDEDAGEQVIPERLAVVRITKAAKR